MKKSILKLTFPIFTRLEKNQLSNLAEANFFYFSLVMRKSNLNLTDKINIIFSYNHLSFFLKTKPPVISTSDLDPDPKIVDPTFSNKHL